MLHALIPQNLPVQDAHYHDCTHDYGVNVMLPVLAHIRSLCTRHGMALPSVPSFQTFQQTAVDLFLEWYTHLRLSKPLLDVLISATSSDGDFIYFLTQ